MEEPKYSELVGSFTAGRATFEAIASAHIDTKPPWQRFMDLNMKAIKWIVGNRIVQWAVGNAIWDIFFSRKRQPAKAWQV